jgi:transposase
LDEHRLGLKPVYRRVWAPRGKTPLAWVRPRYRWLYVYGFVRPSTGEGEFWLLPPVNAEAFSEVLRRFARLRGSGEGKLLLVVLDRAGWHVSGRVEVPEGVRLVFLPPYAPELQPVERVWPLVDAVVANGSSRDFCGFLFRGPKRAHVQVAPESPVLRGPQHHHRGQIHQAPLAGEDPNHPGPPLHLTDKPLQHIRALNVPLVAAGKVQVGQGLLTVFP